MLGPTKAVTSWFLMIRELSTLPDSAEDFLIFREDKPIQVHKYVFKKIFLIGEENLSDYRM